MAGYGFDESFAYGKQNVYRAPGDVAIPMGQLYYYQVSNLMDRLDWALMLRDVYMAKDIFDVLFGKVQPLLQKRKFKVVVRKGIEQVESEEEHRIIEQYRKKIDELNNVLAPTYRFVILTPGMFGYRTRKGFQTGEVQGRLQKATNLLRELHWLLYFDLYRVGMLLPKTDDPSTSLTKTSH